MQIRQDSGQTFDHNSGRLLSGRTSRSKIVPVTGSKQQSLVKKHALIRCFRLRVGGKNDGCTPGRAGRNTQHRSSRNPVAANFVHDGRFTTNRWLAGWLVTRQSVFSPPSLCADDSASGIVGCDACRRDLCRQKRARTSPVAVFGLPARKQPPLGTKAGIKSIRHNRRIIPSRSVAVNGANIRTGMCCKSITARSFWKNQSGSIEQCFR